MKSITIKAIGITSVIALALGFASIAWASEYGLLVFFFIPILIGFLPPYIIGRTRPISVGEAYKYSFITLGIIVVALLVFAIEGLICIAMALPLAALSVWISSYCGYYVTNKSDKWNDKNITTILVIGSIGFMSFDYVNEPTDLIPVRTEVIIDAPIEDVWHNVVTFNQIDEPTDWLFKTGIAYPTDATIEKKGVGAIRYCNFTTGSFIEPITTWDEPNLLQFDVLEQPSPMNEFNPFWDIHPKHLDGYFVSKKGQFKLTKIGSDKTKLEGTTWYSVDITPEFYWSFWSDFIIHRIHHRVLNHIKEESEKTVNHHS